MSLAEEKFQSLVDRAVAHALAKIKEEYGVFTPTPCELKMLEYGAGCGIMAVVEEYMGKGALAQAQEQSDHFAE